MRCPVCTMEMRLSERQGIEIDYCPQCRGIWLDRGELDKIIERTAGLVADVDEQDHRYSEVSKKKRGKSYHDSDHDRDYRHTYVGKKKHKGDRDRYDRDDRDRYRDRDRDRRRKKKDRISDFIEDVFDIF